MQKAYIEIDEDRIKVTDYYFLVKKERIISKDDIKKAEIRPGVSHHVRGHRNIQFSYIIFRDKNDKYLFKIMNLPETNKYFSQHLEN